eukprot:TRINITY_DN16243_c0_g1_i1.p1 TRINITY_DN16243_c0_g1~~TRINITY_DN16243_c0_g1_i1.p1  ORF type:complete len:424 (+),score=161.45 TRINITY_DN16243_c0_g1_i1:106-1377(+)
MRRLLRCAPQVARPGRRHWSNEFRDLMDHDLINCKLGAVPYYEGHPLVAVLFGWPGATAEGMRPYGEMYDRMGVPCVMVVPTWKEAWHDDSADLKVQRVFAELQVELCNLRTDLVLHFFSASFLQFLGPMVYLGRRVTKGYIFDSAPTQLVEGDRWYNAGRVSHAADLLGKQGLIPPVGAISQHTATFRAWLAEYIEGYRARVREMAALEMMFAPQLYFRSEFDPLIRPKEFDELIEYNRERKNMKVWEVVWPGDRHMGHLEAHGEEYEGTLRDFVNSIMPIRVEQLEVGRGAGAEWPPGVPTEEEMGAANKWTRAYLSPYHEDEIRREEQMKGKRKLLKEQKAAIAGGKTLFRYPDGTIRELPASQEETDKYIAENTRDFPPGVLDLSGRSHIQRTPENAENYRDQVLPPRHVVVHRDEDKL